MDRRGINGARGERGLTLLELLVVMAILALLVSVAVFNAPPPRSNARDEAERFAARLVVASEDAVLQGSVMRIEVTPGGYAVARYANGEWKADDGAGRFAAHSFAPNVAVALTIDDAALANRRGEDTTMKKDEPQRLILDPLGAAPAFTIAFADSRGRWRVRSNDDQTIEVGEDGLQ